VVALVAHWSRCGCDGWLLAIRAVQHGGKGGKMATVTAMLVLCATLMTLWGATMLVWLSSDRPLVQVTVQILNPAPVNNHVPEVVRRAYA